MNRIDELLTRWQLLEIWQGFWHFLEESEKENENALAMGKFAKEFPEQADKYRRLGKMAGESRKTLLAQWQKLSFELAELSQLLPGEVAAKMYRNTSKPGPYTALKCAENITMVAGLYRDWMEKSKSAEIAGGNNGTPADANNITMPTAQNITGPDLADYLGVPKTTVESFLRRQRENFPDCFERIEHPRRNGPKYLHRTRDIWPDVIKNLPRWKA